MPSPNKERRYGKEEKEKEEELATLPLDSAFFKSESHKLGFPLKWTSAGVMPCGTAYLYFHARHCPCGGDFSAASQVKPTETSFPRAYAQRLASPSQ